MDSGKPQNRRSFIKASALAAGASIWPGLKVAKGNPDRGRKDKAPNILFILTDQQRYDSLGCNGNPGAITPHIDALANGGARFTSPYVTQPVCSPCRSSIITGFYPHRTGVVDNNIPLMNHETSFPRLLHGAGYKTGYFGKWHLGPRAPEKELGEGYTVDPPPSYFDEWKGYHTGAHFWLNTLTKGGGKHREVPVNSPSAIPDFEGVEEHIYRTDHVTDQVIDFIKKNRRERFCAIAGIYPPHQPWSAPRENCVRFQGRVKYPVYHAMVNRVDENVGRLMKALEDANIEEETLIIFTSEHGHLFNLLWNSTEEEANYKRVCYDPAARVPLIFHWKSHLHPGTYENVVSMADLAPTILEICGISAPRRLHGKSLVSQLQGSKPEEDPVVFMQNYPFKYPVDHGMFERCVVTDEWKLILNTERVPELYNRRKDPEEKHNVYSESALSGIKKRLFAHLEKWAWEVEDNQTFSRYLFEQWHP